MERLQEHLQAENYELSAQDIFDDEGYSGASLKRPALDRLRDAVAQNRFDRVLITAPDRLARNYVHQVLLLEELQKQGCRVEFLDRPLSQDPHDQLLLQIRGAVAEYERTLIVERTRRGRLAKLKAGSLLPWTLPPFGYRTAPDRPRDSRCVRIDEAQGAIVQEIFTRYLQTGVTLYSLAQELQARCIATPRGQRLWNLGTLRGILSNPAYTGLLYAQRKEPKPVRNRRSPLQPVGQTHYRYVEQPPDHWLLVAQIPALVSQQQFRQVQEKLSHNQRCARRNNHAHDYLLRALVSCGHCRLTAAGRASKDHSYYVCKGKGPAIWSRREEKCPGRSIPASQLDALVWRDLCEVLQHPESLRYALQRAHGGHWEPEYLLKRRAQFRAGQAQLQRQLERLTEAYLSAVIPLPEYQHRRQDLEVQLQTLLQSERQLDADSHHLSHVASLARSIEDFAARARGSLEHASFDQKRQLVELLIDRVIVTDDNVEIRYVLPTTPASEQVRFCHLRTDYLRSMSGGSSRLIGLDPVPTGQEFRLRFSPKMRGYLYLVAPGTANAPTTWLTDQPHPDTGIKTNLIQPETEFVFPGNTWFRAKDLSSMTFTAIFSPRAPNKTNAPILPGFLTAQAMRRLTTAEQEELTELRQGVAAAAAELVTQSGDPAVKITRRSIGSNQATDLVIIDIPVTRR